MTKIIVEYCDDMTGEVIYRSVASCYDTDHLTDTLLKIAHIHDYNVRVDLYNRLRKSGIKK